MRRFHPFTLVELLCVVIVISLLAALSIQITQIAYRRADATKTQTVMEIIRNANEQYKVKNGYYLPNSKCESISSIKIHIPNKAGNLGDHPYEVDQWVADEFSLDEEAYSIPLDPDFLGDAYETCRASAKEYSKDCVVDSWGNPIRYRCPGKFNTGSYDLYSIGKDGETYIHNIEKKSDKKYKTTGSSKFDTIYKILTNEAFGLGDDIANFKAPPK